MAARGGTSREEDGVSASSAVPTRGSGPPLDLLPTPLLHLLSLHPFNAIPSSAIPLLTDIIHHYLGLLTKSASRNASHAGRSTLTAWDVVDSLDSIGASDPGELQAWMVSEERNDWADRMDNGWADERARTEFDTRKAAWRRHLIHGRAGVTRRRMECVNVLDDDLELFEELQLVEEHRRIPRRAMSPSNHSQSSKRRKLSHSPPTASPSDDGGGGGDIEDDSDDYASDDIDDSASASTARTTPSPPLRILKPDEELYRSRQRPPCKDDHDPATSLDIEYVPSFLPPFPGQKVGGLAEYDVRRDEDAAVERLPTPPAAVKIEEIDDTAQTASTSYTPSYFTPPVSFSASPLFSSNEETGSNPPTVQDIPHIDSSLTRPARATSSLSSFISDYTALASSEAETGGNVFLPSSSFRRRMAISLTSPASYAPNDTLHGGIPARPTSTPFVPSASHLITLPPSGEGAPRFTPIRPKGRPLTLMPSGVSNAILPYRNPASTMENLARYFASQAPLPYQPKRSPDGSIVDSSGDSQPVPTPSNVLISSSPHSASSSYTPNLSLLHRCLTIMDPEPLRDEHHVERVFRGVTLTGHENALTRHESWFKSAVDAVKCVSVGNTASGGSKVPIKLKSHGGAGGGGGAKAKKAARKSQYIDGDESDEALLQGDDSDSEDEGRTALGAGATDDAESLARKRATVKVKNGTVVYTWDWDTREYAGGLEGE